MKRKKISIGMVILCFLDPIVGAGQYARDVVKKLPKDIDITVYTYEGGARDEFKGMKNVKFVTLEEPQKTRFVYLNVIKRLVQFFSKMEKHDLILISGGLEAYVGYFYRLLKNPKAKIFAHFHHVRGGLYLSEQLRIAGAIGIVEYISCRLIKTFDAIITVSDIWKNKLTSELGFNKPIYVARNSVGPDKRGTMKLKFGRPIIYTGMCQPIHNVELTVEALPLVKKKYPNASIVITGRRNENYYNKLLEIARSLGVEKDIHYLGIISNEDVRSVYEQADVVFFVTKDPYGWSRVLLKGVLYKTPCIAMRVGALTELIQIYGGILINYKPQEFADAVMKFVSDKGYTKRVVDQAYNNLQKHTWDAAAKIHMECIDNLLRGS